MEEFDKKKALLHILSYCSNFPFVKPSFINFGLTHRCNLRCKICETYEENPEVNRELSLEELKGIIKQISDWDKTINVSFAGGEPFIRKDDLLECVKYASSLNLVTHVTSNGSFIDKKLAEEILNSGLNYLQISLDGSTSKTNDYIRGKGSFKKAMRAIGFLLEVKEELDSNLKLSITTVVTNKNIEELLGIHSLVKELGLHEVAYNPYAIDTSFTKNKSYERDEFWVKGENIERLRKVCRELIELKKREGRIGTPLITLKLMPDYFEKKQAFNPGICLAGFSYMYIKPYGEVDVCGKGPSLSVRERSLKSIWYSLSFAKTRLKIMGCRKPCLMLCFPRVSLKDVFGVNA